MQSLAEIKSSLPKHVCLTPKVHKWKKGDERYYLAASDHIWESWHPIPKDFFEDASPKRRPIPTEVLENQAFWVLYNKLATVAPDEYGLYPVIRDKRFNFDGKTYLCSGLKKFASWDEAENAIVLLGGEENIIKHLLAGDLYSKWIGEQIE